MNEKGSAPFLLILGVVGLITFFVFSGLFSFTDIRLSAIFPEKLSFAQSSESITVGELIINPTFHSIDLELPFTDGSSEQLTSTSVLFKKSTDTSWREGLPLWPTRPALTTTPAFQPAQPAAFGAILKVEPGTSYDIEVTAIGSTGTTIKKTATVSTRSENIPAASTLAPTHYVNATTGDDSRTETIARNKSTPWKTFKKAIETAPAGSVIEFAPGYYIETTNNGATNITKSLTLKAEFPAVDDNQTIINPGKHTILQDGRAVGTGAALNAIPFTTGPAGSAAPFENVWVQDPLTSAAAGKPIWKWAGSSIGVDSSTMFQMGFHQTRDAQPVRIMHWDRKTGSVASENFSNTPESWATLLGSNKTYRYGFWQDSAAPYDVYLAPPPNMVDTNGVVTADPNKTWITIGGGYGPNIRAADVRVSGFQFRNLGSCLVLGATSGTATPTFNNAIVDHNLFSGCQSGFRIDTNSSPNNGLGLGPSNTVVEHNVFLDRTLWTDNHATDPGSPWVFTKEKITLASGALSILNRYGGQNESAGINGKNEAGKWTVIRNNKFDGPQNGMSANGGITNAPRDAFRGTDFYWNECVRIVDDCVEPENAAVNWKIWENKIHKTTVILSAAPIHWGPLYFFRNQAWDIGAVGGGVEESSGRARVSTAVLMKGGALNTAKYHVRPILYFVNNTYWTDVAGGGVPNNADVGSGGIDDTINGQGNYNMIKFVRNNIIRNTRYVSRVGQGDYNTNWDEDFNAMASRNSIETAATQANVGMRIEGGINGRQMYSSYDPNTRQVNSTWGFTIQDYRSDLAAASGRPSNYGNGANSNKFGPGKTDVAFASPVDGSGAAATLDALLENPGSGNLNLKPANNPLVDGGTVVANIADCYAGTAPDIGALESAEPSTCEQASQPSGTQTPNQKLGDTNGDNKVDILDYNDVLTDFGKTGSTLKGDVDKSGKVDVFDYNLMLSNFGT